MLEQAGYLVCRMLRCCCGVRFSKTGQTGPMEGEVQFLAREHVEVLQAYHVGECRYQFAIPRGRLRQDD